MECITAKIYYGRSSVYILVSKCVRKQNYNTFLITLLLFSYFTCGYPEEKIINFHYFFRSMRIQNLFAVFWQKNGTKNISYTERPKNANCDI